MKYVDGYVLPVPAENIEAYRTMAEKAGKIWIEHGALEYREYAGDDLAIENMPPFTSAVKTEPGETIVFAYIVYESREHRDAVNAKVMKDPRLFESCDPNNMPFDCKRMICGGFKSIVELSQANPKV